MATGLTASCYQNIHASGDLGRRVGARTDQRRDWHIPRFGLIDHHRRRRTQGIGDQPDRKGKGHLQHFRSTRFLEISGKIYSTVVFFLQIGTVHIVAFENRLHKIPVAVWEGSDQVLRIDLLTFPLKPVWHNQINAVGLAAAMRIDPGQFFA